MERRLEVLLGGPCDGLELDLWSTDMTVFPGPHHLRECGITDEFYDANPMYIRCSDGRFRYSRDVG